MAEEKSHDRPSTRSEDDAETGDRHKPSSRHDDDDATDATADAPSQAEAANDGLDDALKPVAEKIGESRDNLNRREKWFQNRSGRPKE